MNIVAIHLGTRKRGGVCRPAACGVPQARQDQALGIGSPDLLRVKIIDIVLATIMI